MPRATEQAASSARSRRRTSLLLLFLLSILLTISCSHEPRKHLIAPDTTPPAAVTDLTATVISDSTVQLTWTATGDDGDEGRASRYDIRINTEPFPNGHFPPLPAVADSLAPALAGTREMAVATGLKANTTYYFAMRVGDEVPNWSPISNVAEMKTREGTPPDAVTDLMVVGFTPTTVTLTWTSVGDDGNMGTASFYDVRYSGLPIDESSWGQATEATGEPVPSPPGKKETMKVAGLTPGSEFYFAIKVGDEVPNWSPVSASVQATPNVPRVWRIYPDGSGDAATIQEGIDQALVWDTLSVYPGRYYENIDFKGKDIVVRSQAGPEVTVLDGSRKVRVSVVTFRNGESRAAVIEGFTITGGGRSAGAGIDVANSSPTVRGNEIKGNSAPNNGFGGGMYCGTGSFLSISAPLIESNVFEDNEATIDGGGLAFGNCNGIIRNNIFRRNRTHHGDGGGAWIWVGRGSVVIEGNEFWENYAVDHGGGLYVGNTNHADDFQIRNNLFVRNQADGPGGGDTGSGGGLALLLLTKGTVENNTFVDNRGFGESPCNGGALLLYGNEIATVVSRNIFFGSTGCAIACFNSRATVHSNLFWNNDLDFGGQVSARCPEVWINSSLFMDPLFCGGDDYRLAANSPALTGEEVMGAYTQPGCPSRAASHHVSFRSR
jgi:Right handed beta helix region